MNLTLSQEKFSLIFDYFSRISGETQTKKLLILLANMARDIIDVDRCTLWLYDIKKDVLWTKIAHGIESLCIPKTSGFAGFSFTHNEVVVCNDVSSDSRFNEAIDRQTGYKTYSTLVIPMMGSDGRAIGVIQCINKLSHTHSFSDEDVAVGWMIASFARQTLEVASLQEEIIQTQKEIIVTVSEIGEFRSKETGFHVKRVAEYSALLAELLELPQETVELIRMASPLHDIGKIAIADSILNKPGKLTEDEFNVMKTHTTMGYDMLKYSHREILQTAAIIAHQHHEKYNGKGYPQGLKGDNIHLFGRIVALADVYDALANARCYKPAWDDEKIDTLFKEERGEHFDPQLVDLFFTHKERFLDIRDKYRDVP